MWETGLWPFKFRNSCFCAMYVFVCVSVCGQQGAQLMQCSLQLVQAVLPLLLPAPPAVLRFSSAPEYHSNESLHLPLLCLHPPAWVM